MANSVDSDQTAPIGAVCSGSMLFASILNSSVMLGSYLQQTTSADDIFRCFFFLALEGLITCLIDRSNAVLLCDYFFLFIKGEAKNAEINTHIKGRLLKQAGFS